MDSLTDDSKWRQVADLASRHRVSGLFAESAFAACRPILIKGWSISRFYDGQHVRISTDIDVLFRDRDPEHALETIRARYKLIAIDPHFGPRHLDTLTFDELATTITCSKNFSSSASITTSTP